jgi:enoyl-CoA hydratase/carnithine racemase
VTATRWLRREDVYELTLDQAPCNEIGLPLLAALEQFVDEVEASDAKAVIVHSAQPLGFCAGADLRQLAARLQGRTPQQFLPEVQIFIDRIHAVASRFDALPQTTFAALHGVCFGGGFELALVCDVLIADKTTRFAFPELRLGLIPGFGGIPRLRREVPNAVVRDLLLTGRSINATRAYEIGLVSQLVAPEKALLAARSAARQACLFDSPVRAHAKTFMKPVLQDELATEKLLFMQLIAEPRVQAALLDFVSRKDPLPYLPRTAAAADV